MNSRLKIEELLDTALAELKNGRSLDAVLEHFVESERESLARLVAVAQLARSMPKKFVPAPLKRKLFLEVQKKPVFASALITFLTGAKTLVPSALLLLIIFASGTVYASRNSLPGDKLFTIRKAVETAQLKLATNTKNRNNLELEFANARLADAQKVIAQSPNDAAAHQLAINEMVSQTTTALNSIKQSAGTNQPDPALVKKLETLTQQQESIVTNTDSSAQKTLVADIKQIVAVSNDETAVPVAPNPVFSTTGNINFISIKNSSLKIDKNSFDISDSTVIQDKDGDAVKLTELGIGDNIKVEGTVKDSKNLAATITLLSRAKIITPSNKIGSETKNDQQNANQDPIPEKPNDTFGNVIIEQPPAVSSF